MKKHSSANPKTAEPPSASDREQLLQAVLDSLPFWVTVKHENGRYLIVNKAHAAAHGLDPASYVQSKNASAKAATLPGLESMLDMDAEVVRQGAPVEMTNLNVTLHDGAEQIRRLVKFPVPLPNTQDRGIVGWSEDITEAVTLRAAAQRHNDELQQDFDTAADFQHSILPPLQDTRYLRIAVAYQPYSGVSGDVYRWYYNREGEYNFFLGDATGHGLSAAFITMMVHMCLATTRGDISPELVMQRLNSQLTRLNLEGKFTTGAFFRMRQNGELLYCSGGHLPALLLRKGAQTPEPFGEGGLPLGLFADPPVAYAQVQTTLQPGDRMYLYTDGITEWEGPDGTQFGEERLIDYLLSMRDAPLAEGLDGLVAHVQAACGGSPCGNDLTIAGFEYTGVRNES